MESLRRASFINGKLYTTHSDCFTDEHNNIMEKLLWSYFNCFDDIVYACEENLNIYFPINEKGVELLEHLVNCDLISVVAD